MHFKHLLWIALLAASYSIAVAQEAVGINTDSIKGQLHITTSSSLGFPHLRLTDLDNDFARIKFENAVYPDSYWDIAGIGGNDTMAVPSLNMTKTPTLRTCNSRMKH